MLRLQVLHQMLQTGALRAGGRHDIQEILVLVAVHRVAKTLQNPGVRRLADLRIRNPQGHTHVLVVLQVVSRQGSELRQNIRRGAHPVAQAVIVIQSGREQGHAVHGAEMLVARLHNTHRKRLMVDHSVLPVGNHRTRVQHVIVEADGGRLQRQLRGKDALARARNRQVTLRLPAGNRPLIGRLHGSVKQDCAVQIESHQLGHKNSFTEGLRCRELRAATHKKRGAAGTFKCTDRTPAT